MKKKGKQTNKRITCGFGQWKISGKKIQLKDEQSDRKQMVWYILKHD